MTTLPEITTYSHDFRTPGSTPQQMAVFADIAAKHKERCLCFRCDKFIPEDPPRSCPVAKVLYAVCCAFDLVTPVAECRADRFVERAEPHPWLQPKD